MTRLYEGEYVEMIPGGPAVVEAVYPDSHAVKVSFANGVSFMVPRDYIVNGCVRLRLSSQKLFQVGKRGGKVGGVVT